MTIDQYWAAVRLGLRETGIPDVFVTSHGEFHSVPNPTNLEPDERAEVIEKLKMLMGIAPPSGRFDA
jgi:hypothetical protein